MTKWTKILAIMGICTWIGSQSVGTVQAEQATAEFKMTEENRYNSNYYESYTKEGGEGQLARAGSTYGLEETLLDAWKNLDSSIDLYQYRISTEDIGICYNQVLNAHPELFFVSGALSYSFDSGTGMVLSVTPYYIGDYTQTEIENALSQMESLAKEAVSFVTDDMEEYEKVLVVHDWLATYCEYDYENYLDKTVPDISHTSYGALINKVAVCDGYAKAFSYILQNELSIPCDITSSDSMAHAWNMVEIDGNYYHVDVTWDDPVWDKLGRVSHSYFLLSDDEISDSSLKDPHYGWVSSVSATDTTYANALFRNSNSRMIPYNGNWYYTTFRDKSAKVVETDDLLNGIVKQIYDIGLWKASENSYYGDSYSYPIKYENQLIFNGPKAIYYMPFDTEEVSVLFTPADEDIDAAEENIYGLTMRNKTLYYAVQTGPGVNAPQSSYVKTTIYPLQDKISGEVSITGTPRYNEVLTASVTFDEDVEGNISYQWYRNDEEIAQAKSASYTLTADDIGQVISVKVTVSDYLLELQGQLESIIGKAIPQNVQQNLEVNGYRGEALSSVTLPGGYAFVDENRIMEKVGNFSYEASYCLDEKLYERISPITVTVTVTCKSHEWDEGSETKAPTYEEEGIKTYTCIYCPQTKEESIPKLNISDDDTASETPDDEEGEPTVSDNTTPGTSDEEESEPTVSDNTTPEMPDDEEGEPTISDNTTPETPDDEEGEPTVSDNTTPETPDEESKPTVSDNTTPGTSDEEENEPTKGDANDNDQTTGDANDNDQTTGDTNDNDQTTGDADDNDQTTGDTNDNDQTTGGADDNDQTTGDANDNDQTTGDANDNDQTTGDTNDNDQTTGGANDNDQTTGDTNDNDQTTGGANDNDQTTGDANDNDQTTGGANDNDQTTGDANDNDQTTGDANDNEQTSGDVNDNEPPTTIKPEENISKPVENPLQPDPVPNPAPEKVVLEKGMTFTDEITQNKYKITKLSGNTAEVAFIGTANAKIKKLIIPETVTYEGTTFKVTSIAKNALKNQKKLTALTIGANVKKIEASAFEGCKKLKTITIKSTKIKSFGKNCIKNIHKNAKLKCPKSKRSTYKKKLTKKTGWQKSMKVM